MRQAAFFGVLVSLMSLLGGCETQEALNRCNQAYNDLKTRCPPGSEASQTGCAPQLDNKLLAQYLDSLGWKYKFENNKFFVLPFDFEGEVYKVVLLLEEKDRLDILMPNLGRVDLLNEEGEKWIVDLMMLAMLMSLNYQQNFIKYGWDQEDGEIRAMISLPLEDGISAKTVKIYVSLLLQGVVGKDSMPKTLAEMKNLTREELLSRLRKIATPVSGAAKK